MKTLTHLELFAGIGGFRRAIDLLGNDFGISTKCVGFSEWDSYANRTYKANNDTFGEIEIGDIQQFCANPKNIEMLPDFQLLSGGFPCQPFSMMGKQEGFEDNRGNLFYQIADILRIKKPPFVLLENVKNLYTHNQGDTFREIKKTLKSCGYNYIVSDIFNSANFDLAQTRNRIYIFATTVEIPFFFDFTQSGVKRSFSPLNGQCSIIRQKNVLDVLEKNVAQKYYLSEKIKPTILADGSKNFKSKSEINQLIARPLTATMVKMHRACQDNYYSDDFLQADDPISYRNLYFSKEDLASKNIRKLTPLEALALQGFDETFYKNAIKAGVSDHQIYKQAGNAVSVNTVYAILHHLFVKHNLLDNL